MGQRGAVAFSFVLVFVSLLLFSALAIDAGRLYAEQRRLQKQVDLAALSLGRHGCYIDGRQQADELEAMVRANLAANGFAADEVNMRLQFGQSYIADSHWHIDTGNAGSAGRIELSRRVPASLLAGGLLGQEITLGASAGIHKQMTVGHSLGSGLASLDEGLLNALLGGLLGAELDLDLVHYQGLARSRVHLGRLLQLLGEENAIELGLGSTRELLDTAVPLGTLLQLMVAAVDQEQTAGLDLGLLAGSLRAAAEVENAMVSLAELLFLQTPGDDDQERRLEQAALQTQLNALELIKGAIMVANRDNAVDLGLGAGDFPLISHLAGLSIRARVIEPPRYRLGLLPGEAGELYMETAQLNLTLTADVLSAPLDLNILGLAGVRVDPFRLHLGVDAGSARSNLLRASGCSLQEPTTVDFEVTPGLAALGIHTPHPLRLSAMLLGLRIPLADVNLGPIDAEAAPEAPLQVSFSPSMLPSDEESVSSPLGDSLSHLLWDALGQLDDSTMQVTALGVLPVGGVTAALLSELITPIVAPLLESLIEMSLEPLLDTLGLSPGNAYLRVDSLDVMGGGLIE
ncbi:pilus assembly protein TadG-related protein [Zobellella denitrificans]